MDTAHEFVLERSDSAILRLVDVEWTPQSFAIVVAVGPEGQVTITRVDDNGRRESLWSIG